MRRKKPLIQGNWGALALLLAVSLLQIPELHGQPAPAEPPKSVQGVGAPPAELPKVVSLPMPAEPIARPVQRPPRPAPRGPVVTLRNKADGSVEVLSDGEVLDTYAPGTFSIGAWSKDVARFERQRREAIQAADDAQLAEDAEAEIEAAKAAEAAKKKEAAAAERDAKERAALAKQAVRYLDDTTGHYVQAVPLSALDQPEAKAAGAKKAKPGKVEEKSESRKALEEKAVTIRDSRTGRHVKVIPLDALTGEAPAPKN
ncbi:MAG: hypothetical protein HYV27_16865 [Candidatus Hydrogenedentes bacterium]|nr:hypothetical protein [Candidatus Hydrogenedentota bacterium]